MRHLLITACLCASFAAPAAAQQPPKVNPARVVNTSNWPERFWVGVNVAGQAPAAGSFSDTFDIQQFVETGHVTTRYPSKAGVMADGTFGVRFGKRGRIGVALGVTRASNRANAAVTAEVPHPFFDNQLRHIEGRTSTTHTDVAAHLRLAYLTPVGRRLRVILSGGPSFYSVEQTFVTDVQYSQTFPFDTATFSGATTKRATSTAPGFNVGTDVTWMLGRRIGTGASLQYSRASVKENATGSRKITVDGGGAQLGLGIRLFF